MEKFIVAIETVKIKDFLFSTNKLRVIRGASFLLDYLNQVEVPKILEENGVKEENKIYVGAGNAKFFVEGQTKEEIEEKVKKIIEEVKELYKNEAPGAKVVGVYVPTEYKKGEKSPIGKEVWFDLDKLGELTAMEKSRGFSTLNIDLPYIEKCELSGNEVAEVDYRELEKDLTNLGYYLDETEGEIFVKIGKKEELDSSGEVDRIKIKTIRDQVKNLAKNTGRVSEATLKKIIASNLIKDSKVALKKKVGFYQYVRKRVKDENLSLDIRTNVDDFENEDSFIGFVYSDGDGLGDFLKNIKEKFIKLNKSNSEDRYLEFLKVFSKTLDEVTKSSLANTLIEIFKNVKDEKRWGEFLIVGGDDVCAVFDPTLALEISSNFQKKFEIEMQDKMNQELKKIVEGIEGKEDRITSSSGVIIAKAKTPMFQLFEQGLKLQKKAKSKRTEVKEELKSIKTGFIDFQVIGSEGAVNIDEFRRAISIDNNKVMERPYAINIEENSKNVKNFNTLIELIKEFKKRDFPSNKLRYIYDLKRNSSLKEYEKKMEFINILSKMEEKHIKLIREMEIDYKNYESFDKNFENIFDILEIYKFIDERDEIKDGDK